LIHEGIPKITDFGSGKQMGVKTKHKNGVMGAICYLEPQRCGNQEYNEDYKTEMPSDIYSLGVIFWQIFSGQKPFEDVKQNLRQKCKNEQKLYVKGIWDLFNEILNGKREKAIEGTPKKFVQLYEACWDSDPKNRPTISKVVEMIETILKDDPVEMVFIVILFHLNIIYYYF